MHKVGYIFTVIAAAAKCVDLCINNTQHRTHTDVMSSPSEMGNTLQFVFRSFTLATLFFRRQCVGLSKSNWNFACFVASSPVKVCG